MTLPAFAGGGILTCLEHLQLTPIPLRPEAKGPTLEPRQEQSPARLSLCCLLKSYLVL